MVPALKLNIGKIINSVIALTLLGNIPYTRNNVNFGTNSKIAGVSGTFQCEVHG